MNKIAGNFMKAGVIYALIGFALGVVMGATGNFGMRSVHSHLNLVGWASMAIFAFYYQVVPAASSSALARVHFLIANLGLIVISVSLAMMVTGAGGGAAAGGAAIGSIITLISILIFVFVVFRSTGAACCER